MRLFIIGLILILFSQYSSSQNSQLKKLLDNNRYFLADISMTIYAGENSQTLHGTLESTPEYTYYTLDNTEFIISNDIQLKISNAEKKLVYTRDNNNAVDQGSIMDLSLAKLEFYYFPVKVKEMADVFVFEFIPIDNMTSVIGPMRIEATKDLQIKKVVTHMPKSHPYHIDRIEYAYNNRKSKKGNEIDISKIFRVEKGDIIFKGRYANYQIVE